MKTVLKFVFVIVVFVFYYVVFCAIEGMDFGDPWKKLMKWAKGESK